MQIVVQQRKAHIIRTDTVGAMLIHTQRRSAAQLRFQILIDRRETTVKPDHERQVFTRGQFNQALCVRHIFCQWLIHANMHACV
ncbi:hypothetical protein D3C80_2017850 [compost metagenome]